MQIAKDLMLIFDTNVESLGVLYSVADELGCERVEPKSPADLHEILAVRQPTIAVVAVDTIESDSLAIFHALADHGARPAIILVGSLNTRVLACARRAATARGLTVVGTSARPLDPAKIERALMSHLTAPSSITPLDFQQAIAMHELHLVYQPKVALTGDLSKVIGVEALVRWQHPRRGLLRPIHFLPAVEQHGMMSALTDFVMTEAVRQAGVWHAQGLYLEMTVNLSPRLVQDGAFPERVNCLLREHGLPPDKLVFDITEACGADDSDLLLDVYTKLRNLGVGLSLDNFGTGLSSLTELYRMPFSEVKVDRTLLADVPHESDAQVIVRAIVDLAHALQLTVCAQGVETREVLDFVQTAGFDSAQGQLFCFPGTAAQVEEIVAAGPHSPRTTSDTWRTLRAPTVEETAQPRSLRRTQKG